MIYLDNSSTTHKKPLKVKLALIKGISTLSVNPSRASYKRALIGANKVFETREKLAELFNCKAENIIFTSGCTMALNLAIQSTAKQNGHIITTIYEHNSTLRPLEKLKITHNISVTYVEPDIDGKIIVQDIEKEINQNTYMIIINHTSNVTGATQDIESIGKITKKHNLIFLVDGAQSAGHKKIDIEKFNINLLCLAGHKGFYASQGIGVLIANNIQIKPLILGGTGTQSESLIQPEDYPDGFESGTPNLPAILSLHAGVSFLVKKQNKINNLIHNLTSFLIEELKKINNLKLYGNAKAGIVSFQIANKTSVEVSNILDAKYNIATRSGLHCAPLIHKYLNTLENGLTRISISYFNNKREIKKLIKAIKEIALM